MDWNRFSRHLPVSVAGIDRLEMALAEAKDRDNEIIHLEGKSVVACVYINCLPNEREVALFSHFYIDIYFLDISVIMSASDYVKSCVDIINSYSECAQGLFLVFNKERRGKDIAKAILKSLAKQEGNKLRVERLCYDL